MFRFLFVLLFSFILAFEGKAQSYFAQANQVPLLLNPSLAGAKEKKRLALGWNTAKGSQKQESNYAFGYDQVIRKIGSGIGAYYTFHDQKNDHLAENWKPLLPSEVVGANYLASYQQYLAGVCIAPKFNIMSRTNPNKIKYTFSPSIFVEMGKETRTSIDQFSSRTYQSTLYSVEHPSGVAMYDSTTSRYVKGKIGLNLIRTGIGLQLNSGNLILLSKIAFERSVSDEKILIGTFNKEQGLSREISTNLKQTLYAIEPNFHLSYTMSKKEDAKFSFTPIAGIGLKHYFNLGTAPDSSENIIVSRNLSQRKKTKINYKHASANFRFSKLLFGLAFTQFTKNTYAGASLGFQNKWMKVMGNFSTGMENISGSKSSIEISLGLFI